MYTGVCVHCRVCVYTGVHTEDVRSAGSSYLSGTANTKAVYYRAQGWLRLEEDDQALADLKKTQEIAPEGKAI